MKKFIAASCMLLVFAGCSGAKKETPFDKKVVQLAERVVMLQQTIEIQAKEMEKLRAEVISLKSQSSEARTDNSLLKELETRVSDLEGSGYLK